MKYAALLIAAVLATTSFGCATMGHGLLAGCSAGCSDCPMCTADQECADCQAADAHGLLHHHAQAAMTPEPGPQVGTVTYPYYTFHGPRDFLQASPPRLGP